VSELSPKLVDAIVNAYATAKGIPVEQARSIVEPLLSRSEYRNDLEKFLRDLGLLSDVLSRIPPESREVVTKAVLDKMAYEDDDEGFNINSIRKLALELGVINTILKSVFGNNDSEHPEVKALRERNEALEKEIKELKEMLMKKEIEERERKLMETIENLRKEIERVKEDINNVKNIPTDNTPKKSALEELSDMVDRLEKELSALEKLGIRIGNKYEPEITTKRMEIEREKSRAWNELLTKHIGPALADIIKNPEKIVKLIRYARMATSTPNYMEQHASGGEEREVEELPTLDKYLEEVEEGGSEQEKG